MGFKNNRREIYFGRGGGAPFLITVAMRNGLCAETTSLADPGRFVLGNYNP